MIYATKNIELRTKILVVDDEKDMCNVISHIFREEGYLVNIAHNGESALGKLKKQKYDLMILDFKLSGISGLTILEEANQISPTLPVIMISAFGDKNVKAKAQKLGSAYFLDKPFDIAKLLRIAKNLLAHERKKIS